MKKKIIIGVIIASLLIIVVGVVITYNLLEKSVTNRESFEFKTENLGNVPIDTVDNDKREQSFLGKVVESNEKRIIVEPNENETIRKSGDKVYIGLVEENDAVYEVGTNVKITYKGTVMTTYPLQINTTNIEVKTAYNFELMFSNKKPTDSYKIYTILSKTETDKYNYTIYGYDGIVNIKIDGQDYSLKEALLQNKITMEEILEKANEDLKNEKYKILEYNDGGSIEYHYDNYTIIKCYSGDGNRDVYIGTKNMTLNDAAIQNQLKVKETNYNIRDISINGMKLGDIATEEMIKNEVTDAYFRYSYKNINIDVDNTTNEINYLGFNSNWYGNILAQGIKDINIKCNNQKLETIEDFEEYFGKGTVSYWDNDTNSAYSIVYEENNAILSLDVKNGVFINIKLKDKNFKEKSGYNVRKNI